MGSNGMRAAVAHLDDKGRIRIDRRRRAAVRMGHRVFVDGRIADKRVEQAVAALAQFRSMFDEHGVAGVRAVATSAVRSAVNRKAVMETICRQSGINLEIISGSEEARLVRSAVVRAFQGKTQPQLIADLGGGSLELSLLDDRSQVVDHAVLPLGTVRLLETRNLFGPISGKRYKQLRAEVEDTLASWRPAGAMSGHVALCGGNARALARLFSAGRVRGHAALDCAAMRKGLTEMRRSTINERKRAYDIRTDRAEVMPIAAIVFRGLARWADCERFLVPSVGLLDGVLIEMARRAEVRDARAAG